MKKPYFLAYQEAWLKDQSRMKIAEKSRRIGWTYVQAYEDVRDAAKSREEGGLDIWFTSADISAAREYVRYCKQWAELFGIAAKDLGEIVLDAEDDVKALSIEFASGFRINALSSNPKGFRSKGGKVVIDEFAFHDQADELWKAAAPTILWGFPIRVFSSHNGKSTRFYRMVEEARRKGSKWSPHRVTLEDAIEDGLVGRILGKPGDRATPEEIAEFIQETKEIAGDEETYQQEYMCNPQDDKTAYISWAHIYANESDDVPLPLAIYGGEPPARMPGNVIAQGVNDIPIEDYQHRAGSISSLGWSYTPNSTSRYFLGVDIGRKKDLTVMWLAEELGDVLWARVILELHGVKFRHQFKHLQALLELTPPHKRTPVVRRCCIDATGMGMQLAEDAQEDYGEHRVEAVTFSVPVKQELATSLKRKFEDRALRNPPDPATRADLSSVKKTTTAAGNVRFEGESGDSHADRFWALGLMAHAAGGNVYQDYESRTTRKRNAEGWLGDRRGELSGLRSRR